MSNIRVWTALDFVLAVAFVVVVIWLSMWLFGLPRCAFAPPVRIGGILVAGCK